MTATIFSVIADAVTQFVSTLISCITGLVPVVYDSTNGGSMTFVGTLLLIAVGMGIVYWVFRLIRGLCSGVYR